MIRLVGDTRRLPEVLAEAVEDGVLPVDVLVDGFPVIVTSPPYNVAIPDYPSGYRDHLPWPVYEAHARLWAAAMAKVLAPGGRLWLNVQQTVPRTPGEPGGERVNLARLWANALEAAGLRYRDTVLWVQDSFDGACAWGSWRQPSAPNMRGSSELILVYYKDRWERPIPKEWQGVPQPQGVLLDEDGEPLRDEDGKTIPDPTWVPLGGTWTDMVRNVWHIPPANPGVWGRWLPDRSRKVRVRNLPALFPTALAARCIRLSTWPGEWVLDPFAGHCTTGFVADALGRPSVMVDVGYAEEPSIPTELPRVNRDGRITPPEGVIELAGGVTIRASEVTSPDEAP